VAVRRWQAFTGEKATLLADGQLFDAVEVQRPAGTRQPKHRKAREA
jgi:hypothetical protein